MTPSTTAVIVGFELNGLGVARALSAHGVECIGVSGPPPNPAWKTKACKVVSCAEWSAAAVLGNLTEIGRSRQQKPSLLITKEEPVRWISDAREQLEQYYEINLPDKPVVDLLLDKSDFERLCAAEGLPSPRTWKIESMSNLLGALPEISFPCILKPRSKSATFGERSPRKAFKIADADELLRTHEMCAQWTQGFILQEWISAATETRRHCSRGESCASGPLNAGTRHFARRRRNRGEGRSAR